MNAYGNVYAKPPAGSAEQVLKYLARYTHRVAISNRRIEALSGEILMVIPGTSYVMMLSGVVLGICSVVARHEMARRERVGFGVLAALGVGLLPILLLSGF